MPKVIQVIEYHDVRGNGADNNPWRTVVQYLDFAGNVLAERDADYALPSALSPEVVITTDYQRGCPCS